MHHNYDNNLSLQRRNRVFEPVVFELFRHDRSRGPDQGLTQKYFLNVGQGLIENSGRVTPFEKNQNHVPRCALKKESYWRRNRENRAGLELENRNTVYEVER